MPERRPDRIEAAGINTAAVRALEERTVGWTDKAIPPALWGRTVREVIEEKPRLSDFPTPLLTLSAPGMQHNIGALARWVEDRGLYLAPHGKTTMAPQLWADQLATGAWAITVANLAQLCVARAFGVRRVMVANMLLSPQGLRWVADELAADPDFELTVWADSMDAVDIMERTLDEHASVRPDENRPLDVLVEVGGGGGRTGIRDISTAMEVARALMRARHLRLAGIAGYEGSLAHDADVASVARLKGYLDDLARVHAAVADASLYPDGVEPLVTAGGSAYFELVADVLGPLAESGTRVVLRSGAYIVHDDGFYRHISPLGEHPRTAGERLVPAMHGWVRVSSQPEPGLALFDAGKRDLPFDEGLPEPQVLRPATPGAPRTSASGPTVSRLSVTQLNDQHGFLRFPPDGAAPVQVGDLLRLGLSHPCTAFDKWGLIPVIDDPDASDPEVVNLIRTFF